MRYKVEYVIKGSIWFDDATSEDEARAKAERYYVDYLDAEPEIEGISAMSDCFDIVEVIPYEDYR